MVLNAHNFGPSSSGAPADLINGNDDGFFIVRRYNAPELFVISVVYRGKPTHHLVNAPNDAISTVNKKPTGVTGIVNTIALLRNKQPFWPVPLGNFIPFVAGASPRLESEATSSNENDAEERRRADAEAAAQRERQAELKRQEEETKARNQEAEAQRHAEEKERRQREDEERRRQDEEKEREERRQSEERAKLAAEEAQKRREQEEADENAITGFFELDDPFPEGDEEDYEAGYVHVAPDATTLVQAARDLARRSQGGISPEAPLRLSVGKILKLDVGGESSTEDGVCLAAMMCPLIQCVFLNNRLNVCPRRGLVLRPKTHTRLFHEVLSTMLELMLWKAKLNQWQRGKRTCNSVH